MRANDIVLPTSGTFSLGYPQDGTTQAATFTSAAANRKARRTLSLLVKPNQSDPLASVNTLQLLVPTSITDPVTSVVTVGQPIRLNIEIRVPSVASDELVAELETLVLDVLQDAQVKRALFHSERLI